MSTQPIPSRNWPEHARLRLPSNGRMKDLSLKEQHPVLGSVIRGAMTKIKIQCVTEHAFPELKDKIETARTHLLDSAMSLRESDDRTKDIAERLGCDLPFATALTDLVIDRISTFRKKVKDVALTEIAAYELGTEEKCTARVEALFEHDKYTFPGTWDESQWDPKNLTGVQSFTIRKNKPYMHDAMKKTLKKFFFQSPTSIGSQLSSTFSCDYQDPTGVDKRNEMPITFVALVATAIFAGLLEWSNGIWKLINFSGDTYSSVYDAHVTALQDLIDAHPKEMHNILADLLEYCGTKTTTQRGGGALQLADFS
ncbi:hypothetical protein K435DRAFT_96631 [Dendrothele bispora CBS 962.96]|uniref:DUF6532 domain-containing protein n=1 Tax=Dendrothele bispora (strain CBS 962.96) TaxID=1314807 RepID=A0A4V4HAY6_DENBC|nr:hypothetical protein K435DRAFT_96631 [Dendrothele bispora CBS 962.96]